MLPVKLVLATSVEAPDEVRWEIWLSVILKAVVPFEDTPEAARASKLLMTKPVVFVTVIPRPADPTVKPSKGGQSLTPEKVTLPASVTC